MTKSKQKSEPQSRREIADRLHSAAIHLLRRVRQQDTVMAQVPARLSALSVLVFAGPKTVGELAAAEQVKPPTMTRIVAGLEKSGLARREPDPADARKIHIHATGKGIRLMQKGREARIHYLMDHLANLKAGELRILGEAVGILEETLRRWK
jgi:DNA-binding MarR family transcriptional regulator